MQKVGRLMPEKPQPNWKILTADELTAELDKFEERNMPKEHANVVLTLLKMVKEGTIRAYLRPDGLVEYQLVEE